MRTSRLALLILVAAASAGAEPFFPTNAGAVWAYSQGGAEPAQFTVRIAGHQISGENDLLKVETTAQDKVIKTEILSAGTHGLLCHQRTTGNSSVKFDPPRILIPSPLQIGTAWEVDDEVGGSPMHQEFKVVAEEDVHVPAGDFRAYHLHCEQPWPISVSVDRWFAPGTGFVKELTITHGPSGRLLNRTSVMLTAFAPGPAPTPTPSPSPSPSPLAEPVVPSGSPKITLEVAAERDGAPTTNFRANASNIYVRWNGENLPAKSIVRVAWVVEDVGDLVEPNFIVDEKKTEITSPEFAARFTLSRPEDGWATGKYRVELYLDDTLMETVRVTISE